MRRAASGGMATDDGRLEAVEVEEGRWFAIEKVVFLAMAIPTTSSSLRIW